MKHITHAHTQDNLISSPVDEEKAHGILTMKTYYKYFTAGAYIPVLVLLAAIFIMGEVHNYMYSDFK